jgi:hypothetical protein
VPQQFGDRLPFDFVVLDNQQPLSARHGEVSEAVECGDKPLGSRLLDEIGKSAVRKPVVALFFQSNDLNRNMARRRIELEVVQHSPPKHVGEENIEGDGRGIVSPRKRQPHCSVIGDHALKPLIAG